MRGSKGAPGKRTERAGPALQKTGGRATLAAKESGKRGETGAWGVEEESFGGGISSVERRGGEEAREAESGLKNEERRGGEGGGQRRVGGAARQVLTMKGRREREGVFLSLAGPSLGVLQDFAAFSTCF